MPSTIWYRLRLFQLRLRLALGTNPDRVVVPDVVAAGVDIDLTFLLSGTYRVHGYFESGGEFSEVGSSEEFIVTVPLRAPIFSTPQVINGLDVTVEIGNFNSSIRKPSVTYFWRLQRPLRPWPKLMRTTDRNSATVPPFNPLDPRLRTFRSCSYLLGIAVCTVSCMVIFWMLMIAPSAVASTSSFTVTAPGTEPDTAPEDPVTIPLPVFSAPTVSGLEVTFTVTHAGTSDYTFYYYPSSAALDAPSFAFLSTTPAIQPILGVEAAGTSFSYAFSFPWHLPLGWLF